MNAKNLDKMTIEELKAELSVVREDEARREESFQRNRVYAVKFVEELTRLVNHGTARGQRVMGIKASVMYDDGEVYSPNAGFADHLVSAGADLFSIVTAKYDSERFIRMQAEKLDVDGFDREALECGYRMATSVAHQADINETVQQKAEELRAEIAELNENNPIDEGSEQ